MSDEKTATPVVVVPAWGGADAPPMIIALGGGGRIVYVDNRNGDDVSQGTAGAPMRTIAAALARCHPCDDAVVVVDWGAPMSAPADADAAPATGVACPPLDQRTRLERMVACDEQDEYAWQQHSLRYRYGSIIEFEEPAIGNVQGVARPAPRTVGIDDQSGEEFEVTPAEARAWRESRR